MDAILQVGQLDGDPAPVGEAGGTETVRLGDPLVDE
jgi:hypothetical protein